MSQTITQSRLRIDANFKRFVDEEVLPGTGLDAAAFWRNFDEIVHDLAPENRQLLAERDRIQAALDEWHRSNPGPVKIRKSSPSFGQWVGVHLSGENKRQLWIPEGFAHGFVTLTESAEFLYKTTNYYAPASDRGIAWNDPTIGIRWPELKADILTSAKDSIAKSLESAELFI